MINEISDLYRARKSQPKEDIIRRLSLLIRHASEHFANEERYMETIAFPGLEDHRATHDAYLDQLMDMENQLVSGEAAELSDRDLNAIARWLFNHILAEDKDYAVFKARRVQQTTVA
jgi:hemerythrin